jgi:hypothetical protein
MQYMLMIYADPAKWREMPEGQRAKVMEDYRDFTQGIVKTGHFRAGAQLQPASTATTVREKGGKRLTTDGPFVEAKEHLGGYYIVECDHLDEALGIAGRIPGVRFGDIVEIRPLAPTSEAARTAPSR